MLIKTVAPRKKKKRGKNGKKIVNCTVALIIITIAISPGLKYATFSQKKESIYNFYCYNI